MFKDKADVLISMYGILHDSVPGRMKYVKDITQLWMIVQRILSNNKRLEIAPLWAVNAKFLLQMVHGWSSYYLVFGKNPNLPSILIDKPLGLYGTTMSKELPKHLNTFPTSSDTFIRLNVLPELERHCIIKQECLIAYINQMILYIYREKTSGRA